MTFTTSARSHDAASASHVSQLKVLEFVFVGLIIPFQYVLIALEYLTVQFLNRDIKVGLLKLI